MASDFYCHQTQTKLTQHLITDIKNQTIPRNSKYDCRNKYNIYSLQKNQKIRKVQREKIEEKNMPNYSSIHRQPAMYHFHLFLYSCSSFYACCSLDVMIILYIQFPIGIFLLNSGIFYEILNISHKDGYGQTRSLGKCSTIYFTLCYC